MSTDTSPAPAGAGPGPASRPLTRHAHAHAGGGAGSCIRRMWPRSPGSRRKPSCITTGRPAWQRAAGTVTARTLPPPAGHDRPTAAIVGGGHHGGDPVPFWRPADIAVWLRARHHPGHPRKDAASPAAPGSVLGREPRKPGPVPRTDREESPR